MSPLKDFAHLRIPLQEIKSATDNFADEHIIGSGGFGYVYEGQLLQHGELIDVAIRRLDRKYGQGDKEFWTDIAMRSSLKHVNIVSIVGFCDEDNEKIIINKHEVNGSLARHLSNPKLTWLQRLHICIGVARALSYMHYDTGRGYDVIHRNIKSSKVMLDGNWDAKVSGFGLSINNSATRRHRLVLDAACGTQGYADPVFAETDTVTHKSDVYSFGVVLFEVLCGRRAFVKGAAAKYQFLAPMATCHYEEGKLDEIIDPYLRNQMHPESFKIFSETAYQCLKKHRAQRPDMEKVAKRLEKAWELQLKHENPEHLKPPVVGTSPNYLKEKNLDHMKIQLADIELATESFSETYCIGSGGYGKVYKAELDHFDSDCPAEIEGKSKSEFPRRRSTVAIKCIFLRADGQGEQSFYSEIALLTRCKHPNVVSLLGFCDDGAQRILVYEHASHGSLDDYLGNTDNMITFTWVQRIQLCLDIANGLNYLHSTTEEKQMIVHRDIKSANILLGKNWEAKIADFGLSRIQHANNQASTLDTYHIAGTDVYLDPEYLKTGKLKKESDIYSFGVVLFEILCGRLAYDQCYFVGNDKGLPSTVRRFLKEGILKEIVDPRVMEETDIHSFTLNTGPNQDSLDTFLKIAYQCLAETRAKRPTMGIIIEELEKALYYQENNKDKLKISLEDIKLATQNFSASNCIGQGGFGKVYKGEVTHANVHHIIAAKRLDRKYGQGESEFLKELEILLEYKNDNVIGLVGYCDELGEKIIVYEYATHKSLDLHLGSTDLTWMKRLKICIDVAIGLDFFHGGVTQDVVIHRDIKSSNILLTGDWKAKITDFGLSLICPANQEMEYVIDNAMGTLGYADPSYVETSFLTKESDMYSLGVVLFEILCGRLAYGVKNYSLIKSVREHIYEGKLGDIVFEDIKEQIVPESLTTYSRIAFQCLHQDNEKRPTAGEVVLQLKQALEFQEDHEIWEPKLPGDYNEIIRMSKSPDLYSGMSKKDLYNMLCKGILLQDGKVEANYQLQTLYKLTPKEDEVATDWWQPSRHFFDRTDDEDPPHFHRVNSPPRHRDPSPHRADSLPQHRDPSPHPVDFPPGHQDPSPIPSHHRADSPPSPHVRQPERMPLIHLSPRPPSPRDELGVLCDKVRDLHVEVGALRDDNSALRDEVGALCEIVSSLQNEVRILREKGPDDMLHDRHCNSEPDQPSTFRYMDTICLARRGSRIRRRGPAITSPFTPIVPRLRKKKPSPPLIVQDQPPIVHDPPLIVQGPPPIVHDPLPIVPDPPLIIQNPHSILCRNILTPPLVPGMLDSVWLSFRLSASTIPERERCILPDTIKDNTVWAKTAIDFYLHERSKGCFTDICKIEYTHLFLERSWWGVLLGVEDNGYFEWGHIDAWVTRLMILSKFGELKVKRFSIMPSSFSSTHMKDQRDASYALGNGKNMIYPAWWEVDKVFIPVMERCHWFLVELQLPSLKTVVYDSCLNYIPLCDLKDIICTRWTDCLPKYLDAISYWTNSGKEKPNKLNVTMTRDETVPQQASIARGDCGPFVCMCLERMVKGGEQFLPPRDRDRSAVGLWFRHYMAQEIYARRCLPASRG